MAEYKHGSMDVQSHERAFQGFIKTTIWVAGISIGALIFLAVFNS
ncbi:MAG: aa3-type cytochrome c oxidase subunit IV [Alphaproteobacteria bacterium]|nr:aa3-type cytochrome c oxidase subunit IV [Alphaproteobacteria bacterium]